MPVSVINTAQFGLNIIANIGYQPAGFQNPIPGSISLKPGTQFNLGTGATQIDDVVSFDIQPQIPASGVATLFLANTLTDICGQANITIAKIRGIAIQNISKAQDSSSGGASSISWGASGANPWTAILNNVGTYTIRSGAWFAHCDPDGTALAVAAGANDELLIRNNDGSNTALVRFTLFTSSA